MEEMKCVYILISDENDYYAEQAYISLFSLSYYNPDIEVVLIIDSETMKGLNGNRAELLKYVDNPIVIDIPLEFNKKQRSRYLKTMLVEYMDESFLYLDCDTIITGSLDAIKNHCGDIGAVIDLHGGIKDFQFDEYINITKDKINKINTYFNAGVLYVRNIENAKGFFEAWHMRWLEDLKKFDYDCDQPSFNLINQCHDYIVKELDGKFNCQIMTPELDQSFINQSLIIHYFSNYSTSNFLFLFKEIHFLQSIRNNLINEKNKYLVLNPKELYFRKALFLNEEEKEVFFSPIVVLATKLSIKFPRINKFLQLIYNLIHTYK